MEANKDSIIELGQVPPSREARARSMSYSKPTSAAAIAAALESSAGEGYESDMDSPHNKQRKSTHQMAMGVVILIQLLSICLTVVFYKKWYAITPYGSSALVSCLLCGFSQGLLQLIVYRRAQPVNLLKFYTWGVVNGIWTVCCCFCSSSCFQLNINQLTIFIEMVDRQFIRYRVQYSSSNPL